MRLDALVDRKLFFDALAAGGSEALPLLGVVRQLKNGIANGIRVSGRHDESGFTMPHRFNVTPDVGHDHRQSSRHALQNDVEKPSSREVKSPKSAAVSRRGMSEYSPRN